MLVRRVIGALLDRGFPSENGEKGEEISQEDPDEKAIEAEREHQSEGQGDTQPSVNEFGFTSGEEPSFAFEPFDTEEIELTGNQDSGDDPETEEGRSIKSVGEKNGKEDEQERRQGRPGRVPKKKRRRSFPPPF